MEPRGLEGLQSGGNEVQAFLAWQATLRLVDLSEFLKHAAEIRVDRLGDRPAPNKALVLLVALARFGRTGHSEIRFDEAEELVGDVLTCLGRDRNVRDPFWRLESELWRVDPVPESQRVRGKPYPLVRHLPAFSGRLQPAVEALFQRSPEALGIALERVMELHLGTSCHEVVRQVLDLRAIEVLTPDAGPGQEQGLTSSGFRSAVLEAYDYRCAICGCGLGLMGRSGVGLDAAHIRWRSRQGPNLVPNGFAMCAIHHRLYDLGVFSVLPGERRIEISPRVSGRSEQGFQDWLGRFDQARNPVSAGDVPLDEYLAWHRETIFEEKRAGQG